MAVEAFMPKFGLTMTEGTIQKWFKAEGDAIKAGEPLFEVETEKVLYEVESPANGTVAKLLHERFYRHGSPLPELLVFIRQLSATKIETEIETAPPPLCLYPPSLSIPLVPSPPPRSSHRRVGRIFPSAG